MLSKCALLNERHRKRAADHIREVAKKLGQDLHEDFDLNDFFSLPEASLLKIVDCLMRTKCENLTLEEQDMRVLMLPALDLWLATEPKKIDLTAFMSFCPMDVKDKYLNEALVRVLQTSPQVEELSLGTENDGYFEEFLKFYDAEDYDIVGTLGQLKQLKYLRIEDVFKFRLEDVEELCLQLPKLRFLQLKMFSCQQELQYMDFNEKEQLRKALQHLEVFLFNWQGIFDKNFYLYNFCDQYLPNLRVLGDYASSYFEGCRVYEPNPENALESSSTSSNRRHLTIQIINRLSGNHGAIPPDYEHIPSAHPLITHLKVNLNGTKGRPLLPLLRLKHIESLQLQSVPFDLLLRFLEKHGPNLKALAFTIWTGKRGTRPVKMSYRQISALCPRLERLSVDPSCLKRGSSEPVSFFNDLKELQLDFTKSHCKTKLSEILSAPNLEILDFDCGSLKWEELVCIRQLISSGKILQKLQKLNVTKDFDELVGIMGDSADEMLDNMNYFKELAALIKCAAASLPDLKSIRYDVQYQPSCGYLKLAKSLIIGETSNVDLPGVNGFFENHEDVDESVKNMFCDKELIAVLEKFK